MKNFKTWLENSNRNLLILIHPDCIFELGSDHCDEYNKKLTSHASKFDHVISHLFWPKDTISTMRQNVKSLESLLETIKHISNVVMPPQGCSYQKELPEYLIEQDNVNIFMGGGYEDNCLWKAYVDLFKKMDWVLSEKKIRVQWYKPLIFQSIDKISRTSPSYSTPDPEDVSFFRQNIRHVDAKPSNFHPSKIDYGNPTIN